MSLHHKLIAKNQKVCLNGALILNLLPKFVLFLLCFTPLPLYQRPLDGLRARLRSSSSVPNFLKFQFLAPVQENESPEPQCRYRQSEKRHLFGISVIPVNYLMNIACWSGYDFKMHCQQWLWTCVSFSAAAALSPPSLTFEMDESPLRSHGHSWRQQIFLRVATPQKSTENIGMKMYWDVP